MNTWFIFYVNQFCEMQYAEIECNGNDYETALKSKRDDVYKIMLAKKRAG